MRWSSTVSIPLKSGHVDQSPIEVSTLLESAGEGFNPLQIGSCWSITIWTHIWYWRCYRFNPLQIGSCWSILPSGSQAVNSRCFNPLQIGSCWSILREKKRKGEIGNLVSIPFKSGHVDQSSTLEEGMHAAHEFQSPSNRVMLINSTSPTSNWVLTWICFNPLQIGSCWSIASKNGRRS